MNGCDERLQLVIDCNDSDDADGNDEEANELSIAINNDRSAIVCAYDVRSHVLSLSISESKSEISLFLALSFS